MLDADDRTELPTLRRLEEARSAGSVPRSLDLCAAMVLLTASLALVGAGRMLWRAAAPLWSEMAATQTQTVSVDGLPGQATMQLAGIVAAVLGLACLIAVLANVVQFGIRITPEFVRPRWSRIHPGLGLARCRGFGSAGFVLKAGCVFAVAVWCAVDGLDLALDLPTAAGAAPLAAEIGGLVVRAAVRMAFLLLALAAADVAWQRRRYFASLRMTRQDVLDESRGTERRRLPADSRLGPFSAVPRG